ncbi:MAG: TIGR03067 domain-containing protein [Planctomycetota bacterium]
MAISAESLQGDWQALTGVLAGKAMPEEVVSRTKLTIDASRYVVDLAGNIDSGSCTINLDPNPIQMTIQGQQGPNAGRTFLAVLEFIADDEIRIAYDLSGTQYPNSFEPAPDDSSYVATFKKCSGES